ncbi:MAG: hypothetical protein AB7K52_03675 [Phycisphaerales bacterium]
MNARIQNVGKVLRITASERGSVLVIVIGVLALLAILVTIYATLGQADRRTSNAVRQNLDIETQMSEIANYLGSFIGKDQFNVTRVPDTLDPTQANRDRYIRSAMTNPAIDPNLVSQTTDAFRRYRPAYFSSDNRPANETIPPSTFVPGSILTRWDDPANPDALFPDPRVPGTSPWLARSEPTWLRERVNGRIPDHTDPLRPWLDERDWAMISNFALDGRFVNLATIRNNFGAAPGVGLDAFGKPRTTYGLTLLDDQGRATLDLVTPPFWPFQRTEIDWTQPANQPPEYFPHDFTANQRGLVRSSLDARLANARVTGLAPAYPGAILPATIVPGDWEYLLNQYADADGDGLLDSRYIELKDASDPGPDGQFGTNDDVIRSLVRDSGNLRYFVAARAIDLSGKVNVNTATQFRTVPDSLNPAGLLPSHVDLERVLRMSDVTWFLPSAGYESFVQPMQVFNGPGSITSNYRQNSNYGGFWTENNRDHSIADTIGATAFSAIINARARGQIPGVSTTRRPAPENVDLGWNFGGTQDLYAPLTVEAGVWPFDGTPGREIHQSQWRPSYRTELYRMFARDSGSWMVTGNARSAQYGPWISTSPDPLINVDGVNIRARTVNQNSYQVGGVFGIPSEIDLRSFERVNNPLTTSALELTAGGRFISDGPGQARFAHLSPLRENRPLDLERLARDFVTVTPTGVTNNRPDGDIDPDALRQAHIDVRQHLTMFSGARSFFSTDVTNNLTTIGDHEVAVNLPELFSVLSLDLAAPTDQAVRQEAIHRMFEAAAGALMPFAELRDPGNRPRNAAWYVLDNGNFLTSPGGFRISRPEQKLFYGADREFYPDTTGYAYTGNAAELSLRLSAAWTANLIAGNRVPRTALDPANPIHPDDVGDDTDVLDRLWPTLTIANDTNIFMSPLDQRNPVRDTGYESHPRFPRGPASGWLTIPNSLNQLEDSLVYTDAIEFRLNQSTGAYEPFRTRSEAWDVPVVLSVLVDEGFRNKMELVLNDGTGAMYRAFPGWSRGDVAQRGELAPRVAGKLDLGEGGNAPKLLPADGNLPGNPQATMASARDGLISARAFNQYGIVPQPFVTAATAIMLYHDTPDSRGGDSDGQVAGGSPTGNGTFQPVTVNAQIQPSGQIDPTSGDGDLLAVGNNPDHIVEIFAFQLHNPFDVPLSLSATGAENVNGALDGRTFPDQTRQYVRQDDEVSSARRAGELVSANRRMAAPNANSMFYPKAEKTRYYIEFSGRYYALVGTDARGNERRAITLEPGETRWFYVTDNDLDTVYQRIADTDPGASDINVGGQQGFQSLEAWVNNLLVTNEPLGMSYVTPDGMARRASIPTFSTNPPTPGVSYRNLKQQELYQSPPTRLIRINPRTMATVDAKIQPIPRPGDAARRKFFDNRRAVRLWRVNREIFLNENAQIGDDPFTDEGRYFPGTGLVDYQGMPNLTANDQLVDVLRDPKPWRKQNGSNGAFYELDQEAQWTAPTLHQRLSDLTPNIDIPETGNFPGPRGGTNPYQGVAFINWGLIRRPSDPKLDLPLYRDRITNDVLPEVPDGVLPAYCIEVKSSLPFRAGIIGPNGPASTPHSFRTSLNWNIINGFRGVRTDYTENNDHDSPFGPFARPPEGSDFNRVNTGTNVNLFTVLPELYSRIARQPIGGTNVPSAGKSMLNVLISRGLGKHDSAQNSTNFIPARLHESVNLPPQLQDNRVGARRAQTEADFGTAAPTTDYQRTLRDRLQRLRNASGVSFSQLYMRLPMLLPPFRKATDLAVTVPPIRQADLLMVPAVGPYEIPLDNDGLTWHDPSRIYAINRATATGAQLGLTPRDQRVLDMRWTTLAEAAAAALDFDFDDSWRPENGGSNAMPSDYRLGAKLRDITDPTQFDENSPRFNPNNVIGGCLDRGCFRTDRFVAYIDNYDQTGAEFPDGRFTAPRQNGIGGPLAGDPRPGNGVPMALNLLDRFRTHNFGSKTSMVHGTVNLSTAPLTVLRSIPMLTPDVRGWMAQFGASFEDFGLTRTGAVAGLDVHDPLGAVFERDIYRMTDRSSLAFDLEGQIRSLYSNWFETFDLAATVSAYASKGLVTTRPMQIDGDRRQGNNFPIDVSFRSDTVAYENSSLSRGPQLGEPELGRGFYSGVTGIREHTGFASIGELLCVRQDPKQWININSPTDRVAFDPGSDDPFKLIKNWNDLDAQFGPRTRAGLMTYFADVSIDRFERDNTHSIDPFDPNPDVRRRLAPATSIDDYESDIDRQGYYTGKPLQGVMSAMARDRVHQRGPMMPTAAPDTLDEKYVVANAALGSVSVRSDVFCVWFVVKGFAPSDVQGLAPEDPMIPSVERRYVMVVDRSNVTKLDDQPRILFVQEVPIR